MEDTEQHEDRPGTGQMKNKSYDEILVHLGIKKEELFIVGEALKETAKRILRAIRAILLFQIIGLYHFSLKQIEWNPIVKNEPLVRGQSFVCAEYSKPAFYRRKPKIVAVSAWGCNSQATRQLTLLPRLGPRRFYYNNQNLHIIEPTYLEGETTQVLGLCCPPKNVASL